MRLRCSVNFGRCGRERGRPATVFFNDLVDLIHDADRLGEGDDNLLVVGDVLLRENATLAVLEPLVTDLVAADVKVPHLLGHTAEASGGVELSHRRLPSL